MVAVVQGDRGAWGQYWQGQDCRLMQLNLKRWTWLWIWCITCRASALVGVDCRMCLHGLAWASKACSL